VLNRPQTEDGLLAWAVISRSAGQVRTGMAGAYGLDFGAILLLAQAMDAMTPLLVDLLSEIEPIIVEAYSRSSEDQ
jgi:hypothetical protein